MNKNYRLLTKKCPTPKQSCSILTLKGINQTFDDLLEEKTHFKRLCLRLNHFNKHWQAIEPVETFLKCSPAEVILMSGQRSVLTLVKLQVNKNYHFSWEPWWWWKDKRGWIAAFAVDGDFLLCGVIETLQVAPTPPLYSAKEYQLFLALGPEYWEVFVHTEHSA